MIETGFQFSAIEFEGCRLISVVFPPAPTMATLSVAVSEYLTFWDTDLFVVALNDTSQTPRLPDETLPVLHAILKRNAAHPKFVTSAWFTGGNDVVGAQLRAVIAEAGRDPQAVFATADEALEYIRRGIVRHRESSL